MMTYLKNWLQKRALERLVIKYQNEQHERWKEQFAEELKAKNELKTIKVEKKKVVNKLYQ